MRRDVIIAALSFLAISLANATYAADSLKTVGLWSEVEGQGAPPVVFENGLEEGPQTWNKVAPAIAKETSVILYERAGHGHSAPTSSVRDGRHIVEELRRLLAGRGMRPPYILVGHSSGGLYAQLFARTHPDEVAGMVLVDSTHPQQFSGVGSLSKRPFWVRGLMGLALTGTRKAEFDALAESGRALLNKPAYIGGKVIVLSSDEGGSSEIDRDNTAKRADIARLNPGSERRIIHSGHYIQREKPQAVVDAIDEVIRAVRSSAGQRQNAAR